MAKFTANHSRLYFDTLCRTQKGESVLSLIHATYQAKKSGGDKEDIAQRLVGAYSLFKSGAGTYTGDLKQFESQYTIGHELCIWRNSDLDLTDLAIQVAENYITIRDYFDIVFLNYIQPVNGNIVHLLYHLLKFMQENGLSRVSKEQMESVYKSVGNSTEKGEINGAYNMLIASSYFKADTSGKELIYCGKDSIGELISRCNLTYVEKGYEVAKEELKEERAYIKYLLHDSRIKDNNGDEESTTDFVIGGENRLYYGVPGAGKSYAIKKYVSGATGSIERVVFHPDYTYSDFIGQIMPKVDNGAMEYRFVPGPFTTILKAAYKDKSNMHYLIIEEINRGNASAIFGEVFQLLDRDDTGRSEYGITNFDISKELYGREDEKIYIPSNLTILATMNTSDQNVFTLDTAFQRRWNMRMIDNVIDEEKFGADYIITGSNVTWGAFATSINDIVTEISLETVSAEDKRLGAYFVKASQLAPQVFSEKVLKYLWDDAFKMDKEKVFKRELRALDEVIKTYEGASGDKLEAVLNPDVYEKMKIETDEHNQDNEE